VSTRTKIPAARKAMRVATVFTGVATLGAAFTPAAVAGTTQRMIRNTETGCIGSGKSGVCMGLHGGGNFVSSVGGHWYGGTGCHHGHIWASLGGFLISSVSHNPAANPATYFCSKQEMTLKLGKSYPAGTNFYIYFNNVFRSIDMNEVVR
jgi:hypothetical protein